MTAGDILNKYIAFFEKNGHKRIPNSPLVPQNDPTTLFTSSGMQPLVPYLLGEPHPQGTRLVNVQNSFRAVDIEEVGDNRHTTFFRMLGNWSLGDYFKQEEIPWLFEFLTQELKLPLDKLYVTVFEGYNEIPKDTEAAALWEELFTKAGVNPEGRIFYYGTDKNWWSRSGPPEKMPAGEPGGPSTEVFYDFQTEHDPKFGETCHLNCDCGRYVEIANSVFMQYKKQEDGSLQPLPKPNVDFGGGLERLLLATEHQPDVFQTSLFAPIIASIEKQTGKDYAENQTDMRIIADHLTAASFITASNIYPSNKDQGYILRRLIRRGFDHFAKLKGTDLAPVIESIVEQYKETDPELVEKFEHIKLTILEEVTKYSTALNKARTYIEKKYPPVIPSEAEESHTTDLQSKHSGVGSLHYGRDDKKIGDDLMGVTEITPDDVFYLYSSHGLSPTQIKSLGYTFDEQAFAEKMKAHKNVSKAGAEQKFRGGLADHQERTIMGHTATHLLHQAIRDLLGTHVHQSGSNITTERVRFDFNYDQKLTDEQIQQLEDVVNQKIQENLPVHFEMIPTEEAKKMGAIGLFADTYQDISKIYFIGGDSKHPEQAYSIEFCGGPHVDFTEQVKSFKIIKQEALGKGFRRIYAEVG